VAVVLDVGASQGEIKVVPEKVSIDVTVKQGYPRKIVPMAKPVFINKPPEGKKLEDYKVYPDKLMITGPGRLLDQMTELTYNPIDLAKLPDSATQSLRLEFPGEKVKMVGSASPYIDIKLADTKITRVEDGLSFELKKAENQHTSVSVSSYSIELEGFFKDLEKIRTARLQMILDIEKMKPGVYDVPLTVPAGLPENVKVLRIIPETVKIEITQLQNQGGASESPANASEPAKISPTEDSQTP
jgi:YbbR domain-containing protein